MTWGDCAGGTRDSITIHDGTSTSDPVLLVVCGGGHLPPVTSSGGELLLVFRATPFGNPLESRVSPPYPESLRGFELDVDVIAVDSETAEYSNVKGNCSFFVSYLVEKVRENLEKVQRKLRDFYDFSSSPNRQINVSCSNLRRKVGTGFPGGEGKLGIRDIQFHRIPRVAMNLKGRNMKLFGFILCLIADLCQRWVLLPNFHQPNFHSFFRAFSTGPQFWVETTSFGWELLV